MRNAEYKIQNTEYETQSTDYKIENEIYHKMKYIIKWSTS